MYAEYILREESSHIFAEVVGFNQNKVLLMPYSDIEGVGPGSIVDNTGDKLTINVGEVLGRIIDAVGSIDGKAIFTTEAFQCGNTC